MNEKEVILLTGCSSGIGLHLSRLLKQLQEYKVYVTSRSVDGLDELSCDHVTVKKLDVTCDEDVNEVVGQIVKDEGRIDVLVHCAGVGYVSAVENVNSDCVTNVMNVNAIGLMSVTAAVLPSMKKRGSGHLIAVSALSGIVGFPFNSVYSASKFAVEGYCESLQEELKDHYVKVTVIQPGPVSTGFDEKSLKNLSTGDETTKALIDTFKNKNEVSHQTMGETSEDVAQKILAVIRDPGHDKLRLNTNPVYANALSQDFMEDVISCG